ncbi:MAG TPA: O-antigen ligase family protein [Symbiobacteriaceae bacterium]|jgi:hypothetical protein
MKLAPTLRYGGIGCLLLVLAVGPFFQGLFFWTSLLAAIALLSVGFVLWLTGRRLEGSPTNYWGGTPGLALLALLACYLLQFAWAVYPRGNLDWVLRVFAAWEAYVMIRAEAGPGLRRWLGWVLVLSAAGVAVAGFLEFTGFFAKSPELVRALGLVNLGDRMSTPLQYPNTAAAYLLAALLAACGLALEDLKHWKLVILTGLMTPLSLAFLFTVSRGAVIVLPFGLGLFFLGLGRDKRWPALLLLLTACAPMVVAVKGVGANAAIHNWVSAFHWITAATVAGAAGGLALSYFLRLKLRLQVAALAGALAIGALALTLVRPVGGLLPKQAARLLDMNLQTGNVIYRLTLDQDALKMIADRPLGRGGWGWERSYRRYQQYLYVGRETHSHYLQTAVEAGIPGLVALVVALGMALWASWRNRKGAPQGWALAAGAALIAGHSVIDFNFSYGVVWLAFWGLLAATAQPAALQRGERVQWWSGLSLGVAAALASSALLAGSWYTDKATRLADAGHKDESVQTARTAIRLDPLISDPLLLIGDRPALERAAHLDPYQARPQWELAVLLQNQEEWEGAFQAARAAVDNYPLVSMYYTKYASIAGTLMVDAIHNGNVQRAKELAAELVRLGADLNRRLRLENTGNGPRMGPALAMAPEFRLRYGQALYLEGDLAGAENHLKEASKTGLLGSEGEVWLYAIYERRGDQKAMTALQNQPWIRFRNVNPVYKAIRTWQP